jgi:hypothetical protein
MSIITLSWPELDSQIRCELLDELNPALCASVLRSLPILSIQTHAVVAGKQIYFPTRLALEDPEAAYTEDLSRQPHGRVNFDPSFQYVSLNYGPVSEAVPAWPIAQVAPEDLPRLDALGERIWKNLSNGDDALHVLMAREGTLASLPPTLATTPRRPFAAPREALTPREFVDFILSETDRIWLHEPQDAHDLRTGRGESHAGVGGQYFSPWVMVTGLIRSLAVVELAALNRLAAGERLKPRVLTEFLSELLLVPTGVTGYFGLPELCAVLKAVRSSCPSFVDPADLRRLLSALSTYVNRYNLWLHQGFPWRLGDQFKRMDELHRRPRTPAE